MIEAITEAVRDSDDRTIRRLLARFAEQATITGLYALRDALIHGERPARTPQQPA
ncbi:hypothetical protein ACWCXH_34290 [Kitasatospora sp. NPDC001660]